MRPMQHIEDAGTGRPTSTEARERARARHDIDTPMIESQMLPGVGFAWPRWLVRHLGALFKRPTPKPL